VREQIGVPLPGQPCLRERFLVDGRGRVRVDDARARGFHRAHDGFAGVAREPASLTARTMRSWAARPAGAETAHVTNEPGMSYRRGSHASSTRGSAAALAAISGPTPAGPPTDMPV